jgi:hypothetical protein
LPLLAVQAYVRGAFGVRGWDMEVKKLEGELATSCEPYALQVGPL